MAILHDIDSKLPVKRENVGGYGLALEALASLLGAERNAVLWQQMGDDAQAKPEVNGGWCNVSDGEGTDFIYHNGKCLAEVQMSSRAFWHATALLTDGRTLYSIGANVELSFEPWRAEQYN